MNGPPPAPAEPDAVCLRSSSDGGCFGAFRPGLAAVGAENGDPWGRRGRRGPIFMPAAGEKCKKGLDFHQSSAIMVTVLLWDNNCIDRRIRRTAMEKSPSWSRAHDWKSCRPLKGLEGSNPSFSAMSEQAAIACSDFFHQYICAYFAALFPKPQPLCRAAVWFLVSAYRKLNFICWLRAGAAAPLLQNPALWAGFFASRRFRRGAQSLYSSPLERMAPGGRCFAFSGPA